MALHLVARWHARYERLVRFLRARLARGEYLGLHLTVGFLVTLTTSILFVVIADHVVRQETLVQTDLAVHAWLRQKATAVGYGMWSVISGLGGHPSVLILAIGIGLILALRRHFLLLAGWITALVGGELLDLALKWAFRRPRPETAAAFLSEWSWSFPSGHAMGSLIAYGMVAYVFSVEFAVSGAVRRGIVATCIVLVLAVGISRLYLGVHYFSDVLGGFAAGGLWLAACISGLEVARRLRQRVRPPPPRS
ncbi:MAG: phosphatase PAP2 family protein [Gemmatimonadales bacterium]